MKRLNKKFLRIENIEVVIYTIGKNLNGESNVFLLLIDGKIEYSLIIDCCEKNIEIIKEQVIDKYDIDVFNMICWTHPHQDHSKGMLKLLKEYSNSKTKVVVPGDLEVVSKCMSKISRDIYKYTTQITERNRTDKGIYMSATQYTELESITFMQSAGMNEYNFRINVLAPISHRIINFKNNCKHELGGKCTHNYNEYSIVLMVEINDLNFLFAADAENEIIEELSCDVAFENIVFVKLPHHGSETSDKLIDVLSADNCSKVCATTALLKKKQYGILPNNNVLNQYYHNFNNVFCTSSSYIERKSQVVNYGIIKSEFKIPLYQGENNVYANVTLDGEAIQYIP